jgi:hypothetical protein
MSDFRAYYIGWKNDVAKLVAEVQRLEDQAADEAKDAMERLVSVITACYHRHVRPAKLRY